MKTLVLTLSILGASLLNAGATAQPPAGEAGDSHPEMVVYHDPACGCCGKWIAHMREAGFVIRSETSEDMNSIKHRFNVPVFLQSCHTAVVDSYVIEGHVPAVDIKRLLADKPDVVGIVVPAMPLGSPGMEYGSKRQAYDVLTFDTAGETRVFNHYEARLR